MKEEIRKEKEQFKQKVESHFTCNNMTSEWSGMKLMSRYVTVAQKIFLVNTVHEADELK